MYVYKDEIISLLYCVLIWWKTVTALLLCEPRCEKAGLRVSDEVPHKPGCTVIEDG